MATYTGDILIVQLDDGTFDWFFENGQPYMTDGLETITLLAVFGEDYYGNDLVRTESEKMKSAFPEVIRRNTVSDETVNDGTEAIKGALDFFTSEKIAKSVTVEGEIFSVHGIAWQITIESLTDETLRYFINWELGKLRFQQESARR